MTKWNSEFSPSCTSGMMEGVVTDQITLSYTQRSASYHSNHVWPSLHNPRCLSFPDGHSTDQLFQYVDENDKTMVWPAPGVLCLLNSKFSLFCPYVAPVGFMTFCGSFSTCSQRKRQRDRGRRIKSSLQGRRWATWQHEDLKSSVPTKPGLKIRNFLRLGAYSVRCRNFKFLCRNCCLIYLKTCNSLDKYHLYFILLTFCHVTAGAILMYSVGLHLMDPNKAVHYYICIQAFSVNTCKRVFFTTIKAAVFGSKTFFDHFTLQNNSSSAGFDGGNLLKSIFKTFQGYG